MPYIGWERRWYTYSNRHNVYDRRDERTNTDVLVNLYYYVI